MEQLTLLELPERYALSSVDRQKFDSIGVDAGDGDNLISVLPSAQAFNVHLLGGAGKDHFNLSGLSGGSDVHGGGGADSVKATAQAAVHSLRLQDITTGPSDLVPDIPGVQLDIGETHRLTDIEQLHVTGNSRDNTIVATGYSGVAKIDGGAGNDVFLVGGGSLTIDGGRGTDRIESAGDRDFRLTNTELVGSELQNSAVSRQPNSVGASPAIVLTPVASLAVFQFTEGMGMTISMAGKEPILFTDTGERITSEEAAATTP